MDNTVIFFWLCIYKTDRHRHRQKDITYLPKTIANYLRTGIREYSLHNPAEC